MRLFLTFFAIFIALSLTFSQKRAIHINPEQLIEKKIDWPHLEIDDFELKKSIISQLIDSKRIFLCYSGNIKDDKDLDKFMEFHGKNFHLVDMNVDEVPELIFNGRDCGDMENEFLYIYSKVGDKYEIAYTKKGNIIGYNRNPHTRETLLIHFNYPCCKNGTNNLNTLRFVNGKISEFRKEFFAGRINFMKGPFLPDSINREGEIISSTKMIELRWSPAVIDTLAWQGTVQKNIIIAFPKGSKFRVLAEQKNDKGETWLFVISRTPPILNRRYIVEPTSFTNTRVYGWIRKDDY
ncbi:MAG: hypothetical protein KDC84_12190 [Crocinitomicaceae bacterium]|nr:hypothetical protein [Crocinitomicaceae bacterium]